MILQAVKRCYSRCINIKCLFLTSINAFAVFFFLYYRTNFHSVTPVCELQSSASFDVEKNYNQKFDVSLKAFFTERNYTTFLSKRWNRLANDVYIYSAFVERCPPFFDLPPFCVKFIGMTLSGRGDNEVFISNLKCATKYNLSVSENHYAIIELLPEKHIKKYSASYFFCPFDGMTVPTHASLFRSVKRQWVDIDNHLLIAQINSSKHSHLDVVFSYASNSVENISLCTRPIFSSYSLSKLFEFIIYYASIGVDHFIFYYIKTHLSPGPLLSFLDFANVSYEILKWDIPLSNDLIHEYGQIVFTQDCISRSTNRFKHTLIVDFDEFIVPKQHQNLKEMARYLENRYPLAGSYVIPMAMFCNEFYFYNSPVISLPILNHRIRQKTHWQYMYRTKYMIKPDRVRYGGIHFVWKLWNDFEEVYVNPDIALLHHYKTCCGMEQPYFLHLLHFKVLEDEVVQDDSLVRFKDKFINHSLFNLSYLLE